MKHLTTYLSFTHMHTFEWQILNMSLIPISFLLLTVLALSNKSTHTIVFLFFSLHDKHSLALISRPPRPLQKASENGSLPPTHFLNHNTSTLTLCFSVFHKRGHTQTQNIFTLPIIHLFQFIIHKVSLIPLHFTGFPRPD